MAKAKSYNTGAALGGGKGSFPDQIVGKRTKPQNKDFATNGGLAFGDLKVAKRGKRTQQADLRGGLVHRTSTDGYRDPGGDASPAEATGTSIFDPVLCELAYRWFCPPAGKVFDPFAGGSVRGVVASHLGRSYLGVDLRPEQVAANEAQLPICAKPAPEWICADSLDIATLKLGADFDFLFSCPPYGDLEVYSDDPADLSTMAYKDFLASYRIIIGASAELLKKDRFACFVVGDFRDKAGFYRGFPGETIQAFEQAGLRFYNEAILVTAAGSLPVRAKKQFESARKLGKTHQNMLVFVKGDPRKATEAVGPVDFGLGEDEDEIDADIARQRLAEIEADPSQLIEGDPAARYGTIL